jgi:hypothetical protein
MCSPPMPTMKALVTALALATILHAAAGQAPANKFPATVEGGVAPAPPETEVPAALLKNVEAQVAAVEHEVKRLRAAGKNAEADRIAARLQHLRHHAAGKPAPASDAAELHLVGVHEGALPAGVKRGVRLNPQRGATVDVHFTDRPVILAVCSYNPVKWEIRLAKGVRLQKVIVAGYHQQDWAALPPGVPVERYTHEGQGSKHYFDAYKPDNERYPRAVRELKRLTGLEVSTFQGAYTAPAKPFVLGPQNGDWRSQRLLTDLRRLHEDATADERARFVESIQALHFKAIYWIPSDKPLSLTSSLAEFTPTGPIAHSMTALPPDLTHVAIDPKGPVYYGIAGHSVVRFDLKTHGKEELRIGGDLPKLSRPGGLTFDTKRRRLVLPSGGHMYAYDPAAGTWSHLREMRGVFLQSFTYSAEEDCCYGLTTTFGDERIPELYRYDTSLGLIRLGRLEVELPPSTGLQPSAQLIAVGRHLLLLSQPEPGDRNKTGQMHCRLIDPRSLKATHSCPASPHAGRRVLAAGELAKLWDALKGEDALEADTATWKIAAGGDAAVKFLRSKLQPLQVPEVERVRALIKDLNDNRFVTREKAFQALENLGPAIEPELRAGLEKAPAPQVMHSLRKLLDRVREAQDRDPEVQRERRAVTALARSGTGAAEEYLRELASGLAGAFRTRQAQEALKQLVRP